MSEKRYFKIFSERHTIGEQNKYVALFDELDRAEEENEKDLKQKLKKLGINSDFISADKNYLYHLILRSLNVFHYSKTYNLEIKQALLSIEILFHKGLYHECLKLISKTELLAEECENFQLMIELLMWKKKCSGYSLGLKAAAAVNQKIDKYIVLLSNLKRMTDLYYESNLLQSNNEKYSKSEVIKRLEGILKEPELKQYGNALSFSAKIFYHLIYSNYYYTVDHKLKELEHLQKLINILNVSKTYATENPLDYVSIYNRLLSIKKYFSHAPFFDDITTLQEFSKKASIRKDIITQRVFIHTNTHELEYYLINNDFQNALSKTKDIEKEIVKYKLDIEPYHMIYFYYLQAITLIYLGEFNKALKYINRIINDFKMEARPQVYIRIEVLNAIVHFELKNYSLVLSLSRQVLKNNAIHKILVPLEEKILKTFLKITGPKQMSIKEELTLFQEIAFEIGKSNNIKKVSANSLVDNYDKWIMSKIRRKHVCDLYK